MSQETAVSSISGTGILQGLTENDAIDLRATCQVDGAVFTTKHINLNINRLDR